MCLHKRSVADIDWSPDNLLLASVAEDGGVCLWQAHSGQLVQPVANLASTPALAADLLNDVMHPSSTGNGRDSFMIVIALKVLQHLFPHTCQHIDSAYAFGLQATLHAVVIPLMSKQGDCQHSCMRQTCGCCSCGPSCWEVRPPAAASCRAMPIWWWWALLLASCTSSIAALLSRRCCLTRPLHIPAFLSTFPVRAAGPAVIVHAVLSCMQVSCRSVGCKGMSG